MLELTIPDRAIHIDVCPRCGTPMTYHHLDPPPHHPCKIEHEQWVPQVYVPFDEREVERLAVYCLNRHRALTQLEPTVSLDGLSDFAKQDWRDQAKKMIAAMFGDE